MSSSPAKATETLGTRLHLVDVVGQYRRIKPEIDAAILRVLDSGQFILGKEVSKFERAAATYLGTRHAIGCASGTDALQIAMMAMGIGVGDEIITTPFTFVATTETIVLLGAKPVYVDIDPDTFNLDPTQIESAITARTKAIMPVHLYGQPADMEPIMAIAQRRGLHVIEDAAQALGAAYREKKVGTIGDIGCYSFFPSKNLGAYGDAGMVVTDDDRLAETIRMITVHGSKTRYRHDILGLNSRLDTLQAAILNVKLKYLDEWNQARNHFAARYNELFHGTHIVTPTVKPDRTHIFHQYTLRVKRRDELAAHLKMKNIPHAVYYPIPLYRQKAFMDLADAVLSFPNTEQAVQEVLSIPIHTELTAESQEYIAHAILEFYE